MVSATRTQTLNMPILRQGSRGTSVRLLQQLLSAYNRFTLSSPITVDGIFGDKTFAAVTEFQIAYRNEGLDNSFTIDGVVGPLTWRALGDFSYRKCRTQE
jgi:peptidoglycan hydrolase-like protein with peptidoglycan-binding domain